jgi:hypothetical protein
MVRIENGIQNQIHRRIVSSKPTKFRRMNNECRQTGLGGKEFGEIIAAIWYTAANPKANESIANIILPLRIPEWLFMFFLTQDFSNQ